MSKIAWTDKTWNPIVGCTRISPGCANCYAERDAYRLVKRFKQEKYEELTDEHGRWVNKTRFWPKALHDPLKWKAPKKIFICSMSDLFHKDNDPEWILAIFEVIRKCPQHTFQILTKRPENMIQFFYRYFFKETFPNVWLGTSVENNKVLDRIDSLYQTPAVCHFLSIEPQLEEIVLSERQIKMVDWIIVGGESGSEARPFDIEWAFKLLYQCKEHDVAFFMKQLGEQPNFKGDAWDGFGFYEGNHGKWDDPKLWPVGLQVQDFPELKEVSK